MEEDGQRDARFVAEHRAARVEAAEHGSYVLEGVVVPLRLLVALDDGVGPNVRGGGRGAEGGGECDEACAETGLQGEWSRG